MAALFDEGTFVELDTFAAGALASLPPDKREMTHKPRRTSDFIISPFMRRSILWTGLSFVVVLLALLYVFGHTGQGVTPYKLSLFFTVFVMLQFWNMFNAKAYASGRTAFHGLLHDTGFLIVASLIVVGQILIVSFGGEVFRVVPLSLRDWLIVIASTSIVLWVGELIRLIVNRREKR